MSRKSGRRVDHVAELDCHSSSGQHGVMETKENFERKQALFLKARMYLL